MKRLPVWLLVVLLACCTGISISVQDSAHFNPAYVRQDERRERQDDAEDRFHMARPGEVFVPRHGDHRGWLHNVVRWVVTLSFMPRFGWLVNRHALPPPGDLER